MLVYIPLSSVRRCDVRRWLPLGIAVTVLVLSAACSTPQPIAPQAPIAPRAPAETESVQLSDAPLPVVQPETIAEPESIPPVSPVPPGIQIPPTREQVILLPKKSGTIGGVVMRTDGAVVLLDLAYAGALIEGLGQVTTSTYDAELVGQHFGSVLAALPAEPASYFLYFLEDTDELTRDSETEIGHIFTDLTTRPAPEIRVIGHTDTAGTKEYNDKLSLQRAARVRTEMIQRGIAKDQITVEGRGERELLVGTADETVEPQNRRVEINVR